MKNWKKIMAGLCAAAMVSSMVVPVWAAEETTEEAADDGDVADVSEAMLGLWKDSAGDIYGFYKDNSFFGQWKDEEQDVLGVYALSSDGEYTALVMQFLFHLTAVFSIGKLKSVSIGKLHPQSQSHTGYKHCCTNFHKPPANDRLI